VKLEGNHLNFYNHESALLGNKTLPQDSSVNLTHGLWMIGEGSIRKPPSLLTKPSSLLTTTFKFPLEMKAEYDYAVINVVHETLYNTYVSFCFAEGVTLGYSIMRSGKNSNTPP